MPQPLVSVVVPAHNAESHIAESLGSALAQTHRRVEVIVVDDGSSDETAAIVGDIATQDDRVMLLRQANLGVAAARNRAIDIARGEYIAPLDADDVWMPRKIEAQVDRMRRGGPDMGLVYTWSQRIDEHGTALPTPAGSNLEGWLYYWLIHVNVVGNASVPLFRRSCLEEVGGYDPSLRQRGGEGCEDWDLSLRVAARHDVGVVCERLTGYRQVTGSMSRNLNAMARSYQLVTERLVDSSPSVPASLLSWSHANYCLHLAALGRESGQIVQALRFYLRAVHADPALVMSPQLARSVVATLLNLIGVRRQARSVESPQRRNVTRAHRIGRRPLRRTSMMQALVTSHPYRQIQRDRLRRIGLASSSTMLRLDHRLSPRTDRPDHRLQ